MKIEDKIQIFNQILSIRENDMKLFEDIIINSDYTDKNELKNAIFKEIDEIYAIEICNIMYFRNNK